MEFAVKCMPAVLRSCFRCTAGEQSDGLAPTGMGVLAGDDVTAAAGQPMVSDDDQAVEGTDGDLKSPRCVESCKRAPGCPSCLG